MVPTHDFDGNLTYDGRWRYTWGAENRLILMQNNTVANGLAGIPNNQIHFVYDAEGRMVSRSVSTGGSFGTYTCRRFLYLGWNVVADYTANSPMGTPTLDVTHLWGPDLSGSFDGAGGVGGLLSSRLRQDAKTCYPTYDGNGNITAWVDHTGAILSRRDYSPFGQLIAMHNFTALTDATLSKLNFGFSTRYTDPATGMLYYGYRYYQPEHGRWINRDPIGERGGVNLYSMVRNAPCCECDCSSFFGFRKSYDWECGDPLRKSFIVDDDTDEIFSHDSAGPNITRSSHDVAPQNVADAVKRVNDQGCCEN